MTKKFDVVSLDGFIYLVDKETKERGKWEIIEGQLNLLSDDVDREGLLVIASNNPSIDVPQIGELPEEDVKQMAVAVANTDYWKGIFKHNAQHFIDLRVKNDTKGVLEGREDHLFRCTYLALAVAHNQGFEEGYKAAKSKKWTDEDMFKAIDYSFSMARAGMSFSSYLYIQSLTKPIKSITIEMEPKDHYSYESCNNFSTYIPKSDKDGKVIIKEVEYGS